MSSLRTALFVLLFSLVSAPVMAQALPIGTVTLVVGDVNVARSGAEPRPLVVESALFEGDRLVASSGSLLHVRFSDGALLSVGAGSELVLETYRYDPSQPERSTIKIDLIKGLVRSISGEGAKFAKDKYRLNTPVAAIGVRGTDYVVLANSQRTKALVNSGGIVVSPYSDTCLVSGLGPCGRDFVELYADDNRAVVVSLADKAPRLTPVDEALRAEVQGFTQQPEKKADEVEEGRVEKKDDVSEVDEKLIDAGEELVRQKAADTADTAVEEVIESESLLRGESGVIDGRPLQDRKMVWGRWVGKAADDEVIVLGAQSAASGRGSVLGDPTYALFRENQTVDYAQLPSEITFRLGALGATRTQQDKKEPLEAYESALHLDLVNRYFSTSLGLVAEDQSRFQVDAEGFVRNNGVFVSRDAETWVAGALDGSGDEAGYFFKQSVEPGVTIEGLSLWNRSE